MGLQQYALTILYSEPAEVNENESVWKIHGRTKRPVDFRGRMEISDFAGMVCDERISVDLEHGLEDVVGYANEIHIDETGLVMDAHVFRDLPAGASSYAMLKNGVPLQASITFYSIEEEDVKKGATAEVNGETVEGPVTIYRKWKLMSIAFCRYGVDEATFVSKLGKGVKNMTVKKKFADSETEDPEKKEGQECSDEAATEGEPGGEPDLADKIASLEESVSKLMETVNGLVQKANEEKMSESGDPEKTEDGDDKSAESGEEEKDKAEMSKTLSALNAKLDKLTKAFSASAGIDPVGTAQSEKKYSNPFDALVALESAKLK